MASELPPSAARSNEPWWLASPIIERHGPALVVRDDLLAGGSKIRFLPHIVSDAREIVFGGPFCGGAPYALAVYGARMNTKITLFYAKRKDLHWRQRVAFNLGANLYQVPAGRMTVVQKRARDYAAAHGALFLPLGFDIKHATEPFEAVMRGVRETVGHMDEVWCATGSGMLARCLGRAFPDAKVKGVVVGLRSRNQAQNFPPNVDLIECPYDFAEPCASAAPFDSCANYDAKAWEQMVARSRAPSGKVLFWNVAGNRAPSIESLIS